uniref:Uncharacterized protein n=1 Tax=Tanacetum cinerariifolium TaxID=118510 RepID=A0A699HR13_TANCI|nr:hypothetical protein [Tanacetum cinerariifolium]
MAKEDALLAFQHEFGNVSKKLWDSLKAKYMADDASNFKHTLKHLKEELTLVKLDNHLRIEESLRMQDSDKPKGNNVAGPSVVNMVEHNNSSRYNDNKGKRKHHDNTKADPNKKSKVTCWKCEKPEHLKKNCKGGKAGNKANGSDANGSVDASTNSLKGATVYVCKNRCWFKTNELPNDGSILHMRNESAALVHGHGCVDLKFSFRKIISLFSVLLVPIIRKNLISSNVLNNCGYKQGLDWRAVVRLPDPKLKTLSERGVKCIFVGYAENFKAFRFYVIEPNDSIIINFIIESNDAIFDENRFSSVPRPSLRILNGTKDIGGLVVPEEVTKEVVQQPELEPRKSKKNRTLKDFRSEFQLYLIEGTRDEVSYQHSYCFKVEDDPKTFDEAMKSQDVTFWKEAINDEMNSIMSNDNWGFKQKSEIDYFDTYAPVARISTIRLLIAMTSIHNLIIHQMDVKTTFLNGDLDEEEPKQWNQKFDEVILSNVYLLNQANKCVYNKFDETGILSSRFFMKDIGEADVILGIRIKLEISTHTDTSKKLMPNNGQAVSQLEYSRVIGCLMYAMTCTRHDIAFAVGKLSRLTYIGYPLMLEGYTDASCISNTEDNLSTSGWVFLLGGAARKKAKWLKNFLFEILLWSKPTTPIYIRCDSVATLAKAYSQMYNGKSRHLGVRHNMIVR